MLFHLQRYLAALRTHRKWALLPLLTVGLYLIVTAITDVRYTVSQEFTVSSRNTPLAVPESPIATVTLDALLAERSLLVSDEFALKQLQKHLGTKEGYEHLAEVQPLRGVVLSSIRLTDSGNTLFWLGYQGPDPVLGRQLVDYYSGRLLQRAEDGRIRSKLEDGSSGSGIQRVGDIVESGQRSLWHADRLPAALIAALVGLVGTLVSVAFIEFTDPSFKSDRQVARHLGIPVLGTMPDTGPLIRALPKA